MTNNLGPCYILPDGTLFNLEENGYRTHLIYELSNGYTTLSGVRKRHLVNIKNYIRINDRLPFEVLAELPIQEPTKEQYEKLEWFLNNLLDQGKEYIEIGIEPNGSEVRKWSKGVQFYQKYNLTEINPAFVINRIKKYYEK